jgi:hypothetical protein
VGTAFTRVEYAGRAFEVVQGCVGYMRIPLPHYYVEAIMACRYNDKPYSSTTVTHFVKSDRWSVDDTRTRVLFEAPNSQCVESYGRAEQCASDGEEWVVSAGRAV